MNCPHCQKAVPAEHKSNWCPQCGRDFQDPPRPPNRRAGLIGNYLRALGLLAAPAIMTVLGASLSLVPLALLGVGVSIAAGIYCSRLVIGEYHLTGLKAALLQFGVAVALCVLSLSLSLLGCSLVFGKS